MKDCSKFWGRVFGTSDPRPFFLRGIFGQNQLDLFYTKLCAKSTLTLTFLTSLPMPELLTRAFCRKDWKRIFAEWSLMSLGWLSWSRDWTELKRKKWNSDNFYWLFLLVCSSDLSVVWAVRNSLNVYWLWLCVCVHTEVVHGWLDVLFTTPYKMIKMKADSNTRYNNDINDNNG